MLFSLSTPAVTCGFQNEFPNTISEHSQPLLPKMFSKSVLPAPYTSLPSFTQTIAPLHIKHGSQLEYNVYSCKSVMPEAAQKSRISPNYA